MADNVVFFTADRIYLRFAWVAAKSAAAHPDRSYDVIIFTERGHGVADFVAPPGCEVIEIDVSADLRSVPVPNPNSSVFSYLRLHVPALYLRSYKRAVYLDSDVYLEGSLEPLFALDLQAALVAGVEDCSFCRGMDIGGLPMRKYREAVGLDPDRLYINSGVIVFDVDRWISAQMPEGHKAFHQTRASVLADQHHVNWMAAQRLLELSPRWNFQTHYFDLEIEAVVRPAIFHYLDIVKPWRDPEWSYGLSHARRFHRGFADSPWPDVVPSRQLPGLRGALARRLARGALPPRRPHPPEIYAQHVARTIADRAVRKQIVVDRFAAAAEARRYADLSAALGPDVQRHLVKPRVVQLGGLEPPTS